MTADQRLMFATTVLRSIPKRSDADASRLRRMVDDYWQPIGRILRTLGVADADVDDALQQVYVVASDKLGAIEEGKERAFLVQVAVNMAARVRRARGRNRETATYDAGEDVALETLSAEEIVDRDRALVLLDRVLDGLADDLRAVFVLYEIQEMTMSEIAQVLGVPAGTVASRLRRAREDFQRGLARIRPKGESR